MPPPSSPPRLSSLPLHFADREVHVWYARLDDLAAEAPALEALLNQEERQRADRFRAGRDRAHFCAARGMLRCLLATYCDLPAAQIALEYAASGKPGLATAARDLQFNLSHSHGMAVYAFATGFRVGIDVELVRDLKNADQIVARFFSAEEVAAYQALAPAAQPRGFFNGWARKEAFVKALGDGLGHQLTAFTVSLAPGAPARLLAVPPDQAAAGWALGDVVIDPAYVCALVVEGGDFQVNCRKWPHSL